MALSVMAPMMGMVFFMMTAVMRRNRVRRVPAVFPLHPAQIPMPVIHRTDIHLPAVGRLEGKNAAVSFIDKGRDPFPFR